MAADNDDDTTARTMTRTGLPKPIPSEITKSSRLFWQFAYIKGKTRQRRLVRITGDGGPHDNDNDYSKWRKSRQEIYFKMDEKEAHVINAILYSELWGQNHVTLRWALFSYNKARSGTYIIIKYYAFCSFYVKFCANFLWQDL